MAFGAAHGVAGQAVAIKLLVAPAALGPVKVEVQRFDPVFGWDFYRTLEATVSDGTASIPFTPPSPGNWRVNATYAGSRVFSPSRVGFTYLSSGRPLGGATLRPRSLACKAHFAHCVLASLAHRLP